MLQLKTLDSLTMTLDTHGLPEEEYLAIFEEKAEFACKAMKIAKRVAEHVADGYCIKLEPKLWWDLYQEIGYATDDACRIKQKRDDPETLEARSYSSSTYPTTAEVFTNVEKLQKQVNGMLKIMQAMAEYMLTQDTEQ